MENCFSNNKYLDILKIPDIVLIGSFKFRKFVVEVTDYW